MNKTIEIPVIFYDGEREIDIGKVEITPYITTFKLLQSTLSNKIGISPNQITIYFDNDKNNCRRYRRPVTSKFDFDVMKKGECFLWVVLKRGRRNRRRRNLNYENDWEYLEYVNRVRMFDFIEREKEKYLYFMSLNLNSNVYNDLSYHNNYNHNYDYGNGNGNSNSNSNNSDELSEDFGSSSCSSSERVVCEVCCTFGGGGGGGGDTVPFHWCKNDVVVTTGFRSLVGPIAPPSKNCV